MRSVILPLHLCSRAHVVTVLSLTKSLEWFVKIPTSLSFN
jgi:hypothetical protein